MNSIGKVSRWAGFSYMGRLIPEMGLALLCKKDK